MATMKEKQTAISILIQMMLTRGIKHCPPVHFVGPNSTGKTQIALATAGHWSKYLTEFSASQFESEFLGGLPEMPEDGSKCFKRIPSDIFEAIIGGEAGEHCLFIDEIADGSDRLKGGLHGTLTNGEVGMYNFVDRTAIIAASNPPECSTSGGRMSPGLTSRFCTIPMQHDARQFARDLGEVDENGWNATFDFEATRLPSSWLSLVSKGAALCSGFLEVRGELAWRSASVEDTLDGMHLGEESPWPQYRGWYFATSILAACESLNLLDSPVELVMLSGVIGQSAALEFLNWRHHLDLPTPEQCMFEGASVHARADIVSVVCSSVVKYVKDDFTIRNYDAALDFLKRLKTETGQGALAAKSATKLLNKQPKGYDRNKFVEQVQPWIALLKDSGILERAKEARKEALANR